MGFLLAASTLFVSCTSEALTEAPVGPGEPDNDASRTEVLLTLKNNLTLKAAVPATRAGDAIATEDENYIKTLDVYVFGSQQEDGPYTFQELHYYRDDASLTHLTGIKSFSFDLNAGTEANTTTGLLKLTKGLFVKFYCIANRTQLYGVDASGNLQPYDYFSSLVQTAPGQPANTVTPGVPTEADFLKLQTQLIDPTGATENDIFVTPLPMTGAYTTPLDLTDFSIATRAQVGFRLSRMVARFDIVNVAAESRFTVESISMSNGRSASRFFPIEPLKTKDETEGDLITYPERKVLPDTQQKPTDADPKLNLTEGAFYTWPSPKDDGGYLILKGTYDINMTDSEPVSYKIPFKQMVNGVGTYIEVNYNHRYTIEITKADPTRLEVNFKVTDWEEDVDLDDYTPENDFDRNTPLTLEAGSAGAYVTDKGQVSLMPATNSTFAFIMGSNATLQSELVFQNGSAEWLELASAPATRATSQSTKYTVTTVDSKLTDASKLLPVIIRLTNPASGMRKDIKVFATKGPEVSLVEVEGNNSTFDAETMTATIENTVGSTIKLHVVSESRSDGAEPPVINTGSTAAVEDGITWLTVSDDVETAEGDYTLTLGAVQDPLPASTTVTFTSTASTAVTTIKVVLKAAEEENPAS
ncbi:fimbrial protein [Bacteroides timonensis]|uniref:fimbrial protein n=1 Tax=Bacteroides timonensis TaxID=1470345 RepID=UPI001427B4F0|nr:fimbrial protein [Bacteroides timonensis]